MLESVTQFAQQTGPISILVLLVACSFGLPLAKSLIIVAGGALAGSGIRHPGLWFAASVAGLHLGDFSLYLIGRKWGNRVFEWRATKKLVPIQHLEKARVIVQKHGVASLLLARITPFVRAACYLLLGTLKMDIWKFNGVNAAVSALYAAVFFALGYYLGNTPDTLKSWASSWNLILAVILFIMAGFLLRVPLAQSAAFARMKALVRNQKL